MPETPEIETDKLEQIAIAQVAREKEAERDKKSSDAGASASPIRQQRCPVPGRYRCGSSTHPGAASLVCIDTRRRRWRGSLYRD